MKTPAADLFLLIRALSPAEKRFFRIFACRHTAEGENSYLRLFDAIAEQSEYDEAAIKQQMAGDPLCRHFAVTKRYLYEQVTESLHLFHSAQSVEESIKKDLHIASVLLQKDLPEQSRKLLERAQKQIRRYELHALMPEWLQLERLVQDRRRDASGSSVADWKLEADEALSLLSNEIAFSTLSGAIAQWHLRKVSPTDDALTRELAAQGLIPLLEGETPPRTLRAQLDYFKARSTWHFMHHETQQAYQLNQKHILLFEQHPTLLQLYPRRYLIALNNLLIDQFQLKYFQDLETGIEKLKSLPKRPEFGRIPHLEEKVFEHSALLQLNAFVSREQFAEALQAIPDIETGLHRYGARIATHNLLTIQYLLAYLNFENGRFEAASDWLNRLLQHPRRDVMEELFRFAGMLNLLVHYEMEHEELLPYLIQSVRRQGGRSGKLFQAEALCFRFLQRLLQAPGHRRRQKIYAQWHAALLPLREMPAERRVFNYFNFFRWLERKST